MNSGILRNFMLFISILTITLWSATACFSAQQENTPEPSLKNVAPEQVDSVLAKLSDEQVRNLLISELAKDAQPQAKSKTGGTGLYSMVINWIHLFDLEDGEKMETRVQQIANHITNVPTDLGILFLQLGAKKTIGSALKNTVILLLIIALACVIESIFNKLTTSIRRDLASEEIPELDKYMRLWAGIIRQIPTVVDLVIFSCSALLIFAITPLMDLPNTRYLFLAILFAILFIRLGSLLSHLFFSPYLAELRILPVSDSAAINFYKLALFYFTYIGIGMSTIALLRESGIHYESDVLITLSIGTILLFATAVIMIKNRQQVANYIHSEITIDTGTSWVMQKFASSWHVPALFYLFIVWIFFILQLVSKTQQSTGAFLLSLTVVPLFLILDRVANWVVHMTIDTLKLYSEEEASDEENDSDELTPEQKKKILIVKIMRFIRLAILFALAGLVMTLWGYQMPYITTITKIVFRSLVTIALALAFWKVLSGYIERKILEDEPDTDESEEKDDEWGSSVQRGRSYTLLPMVRKFTGSILFVMVTLIILSTVGIEIGPLLAGAGVVGLAIGFGAQKLVSDIFSGFFYLLDDAFRLGEYLEAGEVSGSVEGITLRNVMLRHHRGMLQIVPYSELGSITNYMRGGIVVKFNLEFPYDTDIDLVRRVIKKVGKAMLEEEEFGDDFIRPVKSQGVREITNSVMVIRVKFTAKPGTQFVIRREAYRKITEALAAKGIHYAHRKVIVEVPESTSNADQQRIAEAGAAAGIASPTGGEQNT